MQFIIIGNPPNIDKIKAKFNLDGRDVIFSYGDKIFNPNNVPVSFDLLVHEGVHQRRQGEDVEGWWDKYLEDDQFRLMEEAEAYAFQYKAYCDIIKDRNQRHRFLHRICMDLSSEMYGNIISYSDALKGLRIGTKEFIKK